MDGGNGKKAIVYNAKKGKKERETEKKTKEKEREKKREREELNTLSHSIMAYPMILSV